LIKYKKERLSNQNMQLRRKLIRGALGGIETMVAKRLSWSSLCILLMMAAAGFLPSDAMAECKPDALGTSRTLTLPHSFAAYGKAQHGGLPLGPKEVVLTFDDGPRPETTPYVLDVLAKECVKATFLTVGQNLDAHPEIARSELAAGHSIGIHSYSHAHMASLSAEKQLEDQDRTKKVYLSIFGTLPSAYRFPFLEETDTLMTALNSDGMTVLSVDVGIDDWQPNDTPEILKNRLIDRLKIANGGIILFHDANEPTAKALPLLLQALKENGYKIVHLEWEPS
jgi:peptidoglycan/xylan/chitin deacetylase (PgdA/CDA1 family)